jgi:hypothetical protein
MLHKDLHAFMRAEVALIPLENAQLDRCHKVGFEVLTAVSTKMAVF